MKFANLFKTTILMMLVASCLSRTDRKKSETKSESKSKSSASKSESKMARQFTVKIFVDQDKNASVQPSEGVIDAKNVKVPKTEENQRSFPITFTRLNDDLKNLMNEKNGQYSLPYRKCFTFTSQQVNKEGKIITTQIQKSSTEFFHLKIQFEYDPEWEVITDTELNDLVSWMNRNKEDYISKINSLKTLAMKYANDYKTFTDNANAASKGASDIEAQIKKLTEDIKTMQTDLVATNSQIDEKERLIAADQTSIDNFSQLLIDSSKKMESLDSQIAAKDSMISQLNANLAQTDSTANSFESIKNAKKTAFDNVIANLKTDAPKETSLDNAFNILDTQGWAKVEELLKAIFPK
jgi:hypothetical protein